jgi:hypothetical protein
LGPRHSCRGPRHRRRPVLPNYPLKIAVRGVTTGRFIRPVPGVAYDRPQTSPPWSLPVPGIAQNGPPASCHHGPLVLQTYGHSRSTSPPVTPQAIPTGPRLRGSNNSPASPTGGPTSTPTDAPTSLTGLT